MTTLTLEFIRWACGCTTHSYSDPHMDKQEVGQLQATVNIRQDSHYCVVCAAMTVGGPRMVPGLRTRRDKGAMSGD